MSIFKKEGGNIHLSVCSSNPATQDAQQQKKHIINHSTAHLQGRFYCHHLDAKCDMLDQMIAGLTGCLPVTKWQIYSSKYTTIEGVGIPSRFLMNG